MNACLRLVGRCEDPIIKGMVQRNECSIELSNFNLILTLPYFAKIKIYLLQDSHEAAGDDDCHHAGNNMTLLVIMLPYMLLS